MDKSYSTYGWKSVSLDEIVAAVARVKGVSLDEAAPMFLQGEMLELWKSEHSIKMAETHD